MTWTWREPKGYIPGAKGFEMAIGGCVLFWRAKAGARAEPCAESELRAQHEAGGDSSAALGDLNAGGRAEARQSTD
jgi:hypothetical protein